MKYLTVFCEESFDIRDLEFKDLVLDSTKIINIILYQIICVRFFYSMCEKIDCR